MLCLNSLHLTDVCVAEGQKGIFDWVSMHLLLEETFTVLLPLLLDTNGT